MVEPVDPASDDEPDHESGSERGGDSADDSNDHTPVNDEHSVSLWASKIPVIGTIADHHWFVIDDCGQQSRWEVWQLANAICNDVGESWDHLHRDLLPPTKGVGNGEAYKLAEWFDETAHRLTDRIRSSPQRYPWCSKYRYWPGPNSNTYVQWVLLGQYSLGRKGLGKHYCRLAPRESTYA